MSCKTDIDSIIDNYCDENEFDYLDNPTCLSICHIHNTHTHVNIDTNIQCEPESEYHGTHSVQLCTSSTPSIATQFLVKTMVHGE